MGKEFAFTLYKESSDPRMTEYIKSCKASDGKLTAGKTVSLNSATNALDFVDTYSTSLQESMLGTI